MGPADSTLDAGGDVGDETTREKSSTMKRIISLSLVLALPAVLLVGCGGDDSADTKSTTTAKSSDSGSSESSDSGSSGNSDSGSSDNSDSGTSGGSAIDEFCDETAAIAAELRKAVEDRDMDKLKELQKRATSLQEKTAGLTEEVMKDPSQAKRVTDCAQKVAEAAQG